MSTPVIITIVVVVVVILVAIAAVAIARRQRSKKLKEKYGSEYERLAEQTGSDKEAEQKLKEREERRKGLDIKSLSPESRERYAGEWRRLQAQFVDEPEEAVRGSDELVTEVMRERGYPVDDFDQRTADVSVDHPGVVENYRSARDIAERSRRGEASTEELRQATVHYRSLFDELLEAKPGESGGRSTPGPEASNDGRQSPERSQEVR